MPAGYPHLCAPKRTQGVWSSPRVIPNNSVSTHAHKKQGVSIISDCDVVSEQPCRFTPRNGPNLIVHKGLDAIPSLQDTHHPITPITPILFYQDDAMASNATALLPGQSAPLTIITSTDQSGIVLIGTALALSFALISILIRVFIRMDFQQKFAKDDLFAFLSVVSSKSRGEKHKLTL